MLSRTTCFPLGEEVLEVPRATLRTATGAGTPSGAPGSGRCRA